MNRLSYADQETFAGATLDGQQMPNPGRSSARRPSRPLRILHTADVHLESDIFAAGAQAERTRQDLRQAFAAVIQLANRRQADLLLIAGDLFDSNRVTDEAMAFACNEIANALMPVVLIPGNHDAHDESSVYPSFARLGVPKNLCLILDPQGQTLEFPQLRARVWGRAMREHSTQYRPLEGLAPPVSGWWNIALAHGLFTEDEDGLRSSRITAAEIAGSGYDYVALGHVHVFRDLSQGATVAAYSGTPAAAHSAVDSGSAVHVTCAPETGVTIDVVRLPGRAEVQSE
jgi:DNA repair exonuclease SbcCD nuclease subunit